jgi:hypothetical protein
MADCAARAIAELSKIVEAPAVSDTVNGSSVGTFAASVNSSGGSFPAGMTVTSAGTVPEPGTSQVPTLPFVKWYVCVVCSSAGQLDS